MRKVLKPIKVKSFLVWHLWEETTPDSLIKIRILDAPTDARKRCTVVLRIVYCHRSSSSVCISDQSGSHARTETSNTIKLTEKSILNFVVFWGIYSQPSWNRCTYNFLIGTNTGWWSNLRDILAKERVACWVHVRIACESILRKFSSRECSTKLRLMHTTWLWRVSNSRWETYHPIRAIYTAGWNTAAKICLSWRVLRLKS